MSDAVPAISMNRWGKDHWSALAYVETVCVDSKDATGEMDLRKLRCNATTHPMQAVNRTDWRPSYGTRLRGYFDFPDRADPDRALAAGLQLTAHDDWDCLDDLEDAGFLEVLSTANGFVRLTNEGHALAAELRKHKAAGGMFANFTPARLAATV